MVLDALLAPLLDVLTWVLDTLGTTPVQVPGAGVMLVWVSRLDSLVPIAEALTFMAGIAVAAVAFVVVRLVLTAWNLVWP